MKNKRPTGSIDSIRLSTEQILLNTQVSDQRIIEQMPVEEPKILLRSNLAKLTNNSSNKSEMEDKVSDLTLKNSPKKTNLLMSSIGFISTPGSRNAAAPAALFQLAKSMRRSTKVNIERFANAI